jgi:hypothetical protein
MKVIHFTILHNTQQVLLQQKYLNGCSIEFPKWPQVIQDSLKVLYKGRPEDFVILVADVTGMDKWRKDHSIPLAQVMDGWEVFTAHQYVLTLES